ncbi:hypothetical protein HPB48_024584 [Haemaphysalis longicornis]|uniref:Uncharacterized protein n=1 Tax=Haemaphysalis longicornis TaxID=44386 RepID=A0A9J6H9F8_HAELO|nr:hypothetical protein HPB48_024584 [Haemaphysalis longicornis]
MLRILLLLLRRCYRRLWRRVPSPSDARLISSEAPLVADPASSSGAALAASPAAESATILVAVLLPDLQILMELWVGEKPRTGTAFEGAQRSIDAGARHSRAAHVVEEPAERTVSLLPAGPAVCVGAPDRGANKGPRLAVGRQSGPNGRENGARCEPAARLTADWIRRKRTPAVCFCTCTVLATLDSLVFTTRIGRFSKRARSLKTRLVRWHCMRVPHGSDKSVGERKQVTGVRADSCANAAQRQDVKSRSDNVSCHLPATVSNVPITREDDAHATLLAIIYSLALRRIASPLPQTSPQAASAREEKRDQRARLRGKRVARSSSHHHRHHRSTSGRSTNGKRRGRRRKETSRQRARARQVSARIVGRVLMNIQKMRTRGETARIRFMFSEDRNKYDVRFRHREKRRLLQ